MADVRNGSQFNGWLELWSISDICLSMRNKEANATDPGALPFRGRSPCVAASKRKRDSGEGVKDGPNLEKEDNEDQKPKELAAWAELVQKMK